MRGAYTTEPYPQDLREQEISKQGQNILLQSEPG